MIINATSVGLKKNDEIKLNLKDCGVNKFFYDVIYNPVETKFLKRPKNQATKLKMGK